MNFRKIGVGLTHAVLFAASVGLSSAFCMNVQAAPVPSGFTTQSIMDAGIEDENFAKAIYKSISEMIEEDHYSVSPEWDTRQILENYGNSNLDSGDAIIEARNKGIKSIKGITLLKNAFNIYLNGNDIHDLSPLDKNLDPNNKLFFNETKIRIAGFNYQNVIPAELLGTNQGNITVDNSMKFDASSLTYIYSDTPKTVDLDFDIEYHGEKGGIFNQVNSENGTVNEVNAVYTPYADYQTRVTGTRITFPGRDGELTIKANAQGEGTYYPPTIHYWSADDLDRTLNLEWIYPFQVTFFRTLKETYTSEMSGSIRFVKKGPDGELLPGAVYELYRIGENGAKIRYPDSATTFTTDQEGKIVISDLRAGTYEFHEIKAPEGYQLNSDSVTAIVRETPAQTQSAVAGGEAEVLATSDASGFKPVWDRVSVTGADGRNHWTHVMEMSSGEQKTVTAAEYGVDCFLKNGGTTITALKGEPVPGSGITATDGTEIKVYVGDPQTGSRRQIGSYNSAAEARNVLNQMISTEAFTEDYGNVEIDAHFVYQNTGSNETEVFQIDKKEPPDHPEPSEPQPVPADRVKTVHVEKNWNTGNHPLRAFFRLILELHDGTERVIGKIKEVSEENGWTAVWSFQEIKRARADSGSTPSDTSANSASASDSYGGNSDGTRASGSNAASKNEASVSDAMGLYDEDGQLLDGVLIDDLADRITIEEVEIPDGWVPDYGDPDTGSDGNVTYLVTNQKIPEKPGTPDEPDSAVPPRDEHSDNPGGSGDHDSSTPVTNQSHSQSSPENLHMEEVEEPLKSEKVRKKVGLPWGSVAGEKEKVPETGEESDFSELLIGASLLWSLGILIYLITARLRKKIHFGKED